MLIGTNYLCVLFVSMWTVGAFGFIEFGEDTDGIILTNYSSGDVLVHVSRLSMAIHIALAYPVVLFPAQQCLITSFFLPLYHQWCGPRGMQANQQYAYEGSSHCLASASSTDIEPLLPYGVDSQNLSHAAAPLPLRLLSSFATTFCITVVAIVVPQAELVFGYVLYCYRVLFCTLFILLSIYML